MFHKHFLKYVKKNGESVPSTKQQQQQKKGESFPSTKQLTVLFGQMKTCFYYLKFSSLNFFLKNEIVDDINKCDFLDIVQ